MEQAVQYNNWIWAKRKNDSWEEEAFAVAEDASRYVVEDYTWPPRSYSCSFCSREFKSAQALGGHMNVHRRDRARLKQSPNPSTTNHQPLPLSYSMAEYSPQKFSFMYDHNVVETLPPSNIRVPIKKHNENLIKSKFSLEDSWSNLVQEKICFCASTDLEIINGEKGRPQVSHLKCKRRDHQLIDKADLSVNFDLVVEYSICHEEVEVIPTCKRRRRRIIFDEPSFPKSSPDVMMSPLSNCNKEELDLELRLG